MTKTIAWNSGSGVITLTYTGQGNGSVSVKSDANDSFDARSQNLNIVTTAGSPEKAVQVLVKQAGKPLGWTTKNFDYTGSVQEVTLPKGRYKLQCWGAQGGNVTGTYAATGSKGGYSEGIITLTDTTTLYIYVGGQGGSYTSNVAPSTVTRELSVYGTTSGYLAEANNLYTVYTGGGGISYTGKLYDVMDIDSVTLTPVSNPNTYSTYAFLTSDDLVAGQAAPYVEGYYSTIKIGSAMTLSVPSSARFLWVYDKRGGNDIAPSVKGEMLDTSSSSTVSGGWNGGGSAMRYTAYRGEGIEGVSYPRGGGGATDIRIGTSLLSRMIVAGGGAGASSQITKTRNISDGYSLYGEVQLSKEWNGLYYNELPYGYFETGRVYRIDTNVSGYSGTRLYYYKDSALVYRQDFTIGKPVMLSYDGAYDTIEIGLTSTAAITNGELTIYQYYSEVTINESTSKSSASQQGGGTSGKGTYGGSQSSAGSGGEFGLGANQTSTNYRYAAGGGGGGWYGGGIGQSDSSAGYIDYTGGGSGFVNTAANAGYRPSGYTGLQLDSGTTIAGNSSHPSTNGGNEVGHSGNGYARITVL